MGAGLFAVAFFLDLLDEPGGEDSCGEREQSHGQESDQDSENFSGPGHGRD